MQALFASAEAGASKVAASFMLVRTRSADMPAVQMCSRNDGLVRLQILVDDPAARSIHGAHSVTEEIIRFAQVADGFAEIYLDPRELDSGSYTLSLKPRRAPNSPSRSR